MLDDAKNFESVSLALQRGSDKRLDLFQARALFDKLVSNFPETQAYLSPNADIVHSPCFESAVSKVLGNNLKLSREETKALARFRNGSATNMEHTDEIEELHDKDFASSVLNTAEVTRTESTSSRMPYRSLKHVSPTSNICERLFSRAKLIARDHRKHMSPYHLELLLFLRYNQDLWDPALIEELMHETPVVEDDNTQIDPDEMD